MVEFADRRRRPRTARCSRTLPSRSTRGQSAFWALGLEVVIRHGWSWHYAASAKTVRSILW
jgi:hypothetical protein